MRVLFVWPAVRMSVWDVATGYRAALGRALGEENVRDYWLDRRLHYHSGALPDDLKKDEAVVSKFATETVLNEALYFNADAVLIISGLNFHAAGLWLLQRGGFPTTVLFTESPYEDEFQKEWLETVPGVSALTNDRWSAARYGWSYVPPAFDPSIHCPGPPDPSLPQHDVVFVGSGWADRQAFLESVDWTGIDLGLYGVGFAQNSWSPLLPFYHVGNVPNAQTVQLYRNARICLNLHRGSTVAQSMGPRSYEIAACGAFQLSDSRDDLLDVFGTSVPTFTSAADLRQRILYFLEHEDDRRSRASLALTAVAPHTFDGRLPLVLDALTQYAHKETV